MYSVYSCGWCWLPDWVQSGWDHDRACNVMLDSSLVSLWPYFFPAVVGAGKVMST